MTLHDGHLESIVSDLAAGSITLTFLVEYVARFHQLPGGTRFILRFEGVSSVRAISSFPFPAEPIIPAIATKEEARQLRQKYDPKWREQSVDWGALEEQLRIYEESIDIYNVELARDSDQVAMKLDGMLWDEKAYREAFYRLFIRANTVQFSDTNGGDYDLDQFQELGGRYWEAFGKRAPNDAH